MMMIVIIKDTATAEVAVHYDAAFGIFLHSMRPMLIFCVTMRYLVGYCTVCHTLAAKYNQACRSLENQLNLYYCEKTVLSTANVNH